MLYIDWQQWPGGICSVRAGGGEFLPVPREIPWVSSSTARVQRAGQQHPSPWHPQDCAHNDPYRRTLVLFLWAIIAQIVGVALKCVWLSRRALARLAMSINMREEGGGSWVAPSLLLFAQHYPVMVLMMCSVSLRQGRHRCSFLVILPQCQSLLAWQHHLPLSAVLWAEHNQNPRVMGSFPVS